MSVKLNIAKVSGVYKIIDYNHREAPVVLCMKISGNGLIVLHTHPGNAGSLAYFLDKKYVSFCSKAKLPSPILGTIAGDDTVLVISSEKNHPKETIDSLKTDFPYL